MALTGSNSEDGNGRECHVLLAGEPSITELLLDQLKDYVRPTVGLPPIVAYKATDSNEVRARIAECQASRRSLDLAVVDTLLPGEVSETIGDILKVSPQTGIIVHSAKTSPLTNRLQLLYGDKLTLMITSFPQTSPLATFVSIVAGIFWDRYTHGTQQ